MVNKQLPETENWIKFITFYGGKLPKSPSSKG